MEDDDLTTEQLEARLAESKKLIDQFDLSDEEIQQELDAHDLDDNDIISKRRLVYKYRPFGLNSETDVDHVRDLVVLNQLYMSSAASFNDPFDTEAHFEFGGTDEERTEALIKVACRQVPKLAHASDADLRRVIAGSLDEVLPELEKGFANARNNIGICSLAGNADSILMWSHYADSHSGLCIEVDRFRDKHTLLPMLEMTYQDEYPIVDPISNNVTQETMRIVTTKFSHWSYEEESRLVDTDGPGKSIRLDPEAFSKIIFGNRFIQSKDCFAKLDKIKELLLERQDAGHPPIPLYYAERHKKNFKIEIVPIADIDTFWTTPRS